MDVNCLNDIADRLNELAEENKDNKAMIEFLSIENTQIMDEVKTRTQIQHQLEEENEQLKKENQGIQDKVMRLLDYVELKQCVTRTEIKKWWNGDVE